MLKNQGFCPIQDQDFKPSATRPIPKYWLSTPLPPPHHHPCRYPGYQWFFLGVAIECSRDALSQSLVGVSPAKGWSYKLPGYQSTSIHPTLSFYYLYLPVWLDVSHMSFLSECQAVVQVKFQYWSLKCVEMGTAVVSDQVANPYVQKNSV